MTTREQLLKKLSASQFSAWETHMFLDTHPDNHEALEDLKRLTEQTKALTREFEQNYGPLTIKNVYGDKRFEWLDSPWPWEAEGYVSNV